MPATHPPTSALRRRFLAWSRDIDAVLGQTRARRAGDRRLAQGLEELRQKRDRVANKLRQLDRQRGRADRAAVREQLGAAYAELESAWSSLLQKLRAADGPPGRRNTNE